MRKKGFAKYLLTWLLALVMVLGSFTAGIVPVQAAETSNNEDSESFTWPVVGKSEKYKYKVLFYAKNYYSFVFSNGSFYVDQSQSFLRCNDTFYMSSTPDLDSPSWSSVMDYSSGYNVCYVSDIEQLSTTHVIYDSSGTLECLKDVIIYVDPVPEPDTETDESWKQIILDTVETWFGGTLEVIAIPLKAVAEGIGTVSTKIIELRDHLIEQLPSGIGNALRGFFDVLDSSILDVFSLLQKFHNFCVSKSAEFISYFSSIVSAIDSFNRSILEAIAGIAADMTPEMFKEVFRTFYDAQMAILSDLKNFIISINDFMSNGFDALTNLATNFSSYVTKFFDFASVFLEFSVDNPVTQIIFEALRRFLEPMEQLFVDLFVPDKTLIETEFAALREKLGFIDDLQTAGVYLLNFFKNLGSGTPPVININLGASRYRDLGNQVITLDFSWYAEYKPTVDKLLAGIIWATFIWNMYKRLPDIIQGAGMISAGSAKIENDILSRSDKSGGHK